MQKRSLALILILVGLLALHVSVSIAQRGSFRLVNDTIAEVSTTTIRAAAQPLIDRYGADVAIYMVVSGSRSDFTERLDAGGLMTIIGGTRPNTLAIYIATEEQYSEIRWGSDFDKLEGANIRSKALNPALRSRDFTKAFVDTLDAIDGRMSNPFIGLGRFLGGLLSQPAVWLFAGLLLLSYIMRKAGFSGSGGSSYDDDNDSRNRRRRSWGSSGRSSSSRSSRKSSGGGSDGGSWDD